MTTDAFIEKLSRRAPLTNDEIDCLRSLFSPPKAFSAKTEVIAQGSRPGVSCLLVAGYCGRVNTVEDGGRQITQLGIPGDFLDLHSLLLDAMDHSVVALCDSEIVMVPHDKLRRLTETHPRLTRLLWMETVVDAAIHRQWIVSKGRRTGLGQLSHLFCETYLRLEAAGHASDFGFEFPISQTDLADIAGMSAVHANRLLQQLRADGLIRWTANCFTILAWDELRVLGEFDPTYLRLTRARV